MFITYDVINMCPESTIDNSRVFKIHITIFLHDLVQHSLLIQVEKT